MPKISIFLSLIFMCSIWADKSFANLDEEHRVIYYYLKGVTDGKKPFAEGLKEFRKAFDAERAKPIKEPGSLSSTTDDIMQYIGKAEPTDFSKELYEDFKGLALATKTGEKVAKKIGKRMVFYTFALKYLTSGVKYSPRHYDELANTSEKEFGEFKNNIQYFLTQYNAGNLSPEEVDNLNQLFKYYLGTTLDKTDEEILTDPLMFPFYEAQKNLEAVNDSIASSTDTLDKNQKKRLEVIKKTIDENILKEQIEGYFAQISRLQSFKAIDEVVEQANGMACVPLTEDECNKQKEKIVAFAETQKEQIRTEEKVKAIDESIKLGLVVGNLLGDESITKAFKAAEAINSAVKGINESIKTFNAANTSWGKLAGFSMGATSALTAISILSSLSGDGDDSTAQLMKALAQIKEMLVEMKEQISQGFQRVEASQAQIESLLTKYEQINGQNTVALSLQLDLLEEQIKDASPLNTAQLVMRNRSYQDLKEFKITTHVVSIASDEYIDSEKLYKELIEMFGRFFATIDSIQGGDFQIGVSGTKAIEDFATLFKNTAGYAEDRFLQAFLLQAALKSSSLPACTQVNLIGYTAASDAANELNKVLDILSQKQVSSFLKKTVNRKSFDKKLEFSRKYLSDQKNLIHKCLDGSGLLAEIHERSASDMLEYLSLQKSKFFEDPKRINDFILLNQGQFNQAAVGGFDEAKFVLGNYISSTQSFDPAAWLPLQPTIGVAPHPTLGTAGFMLDMEHFQALVPDSELRFIYSLGAGAKFEVYNYTEDFSMDIYPYKVPGYTNFSIVMSVPSERKVVQIWTGPLNGAEVKGFMEPTRTVGPEPLWFYKISADKAPLVYDYMKQSQWPYANFLSTIKNDFLTSIGRPVTCESPHGILECYDRNFRFPAVPPYGRFSVSCGPEEFDHNVYFDGRWRDYFLGRGWLCKDTGSYYVVTNNLYNTYREEYSRRAKEYVHYVNQLASQVANDCFKSLILLDRCESNGNVQKFNRENEPAYWSRLDNLALMSAVVSAYQEVAPNLEDAGEVEGEFIEDGSLSPYNRLKRFYSAPPEGAGPNYTLETFNELISDLEEEHKNVHQLPSTKTQVSDDITSNDYFRLFDRLRAY